MAEKRPPFSKQEEEEEEVYEEKDTIVIDKKKQHIVLFSMPQSSAVSTSVYLCTIVTIDVSKVH